MRRMTDAADAPFVDEDQQVCVAGGRQAQAAPPEVYPRMILIDEPVLGALGEIGLHRGR